MVFLSFHANQFQRYAEKRGEKTAADDLNENLVEINERESFQKEKGDAVKTDGSDDEFGETTPFHRLSRGSKVLIVIGRAEHIDQPRREKTGQRQRASRHPGRVGKDVNQQTQNEARQNVCPARRGDRKDEQKIDVGHRCGISKNVDVVKNQNLKQPKREKPGDAGNDGLKHEDEVLQRGC